jgi:DNA modification methylase
MRVNNRNDLPPRSQAFRSERTHPLQETDPSHRQCDKTIGVITPLVVDSHNRIVAGHARAEAAKSLNLARVPAIRVSHLSEVEIRAYMLADNKLAEKSGWDRELLSIELSGLQLALPEIGLELSITGFEPGDVDSIIEDFSEEKIDAADQIPAVDERAVSKSGDIFVLGRHRIAVGDCSHSDVFKELMQTEVATMAFLDPPYNVRINGHVGGRGSIKHREFVQASGEMTSDQFTRFLKTTLDACSANLVDGGIAYVCMDWRHLPELLAAGATAFDELKNICVWVKTTPGQGTFYRSQHELVCVYKRGTAPHLNTFELGQHGRSRSNVWSYAGANTFRAGRIDDLKMHPTVKPVSLAVDAMRDCSRRGSIVLDSFSGSGTTILAAEKIGRRAFCIEIDSHYVDVAIRRWQRFTGADAILERTGQTFDELGLA